MNYSKAVPSVMRRLISEGCSPCPTYGWCRGHLQANISIVPSRVADDFEKFCQLNPSACPLLYRSKPGEVTAPPLAQNSDIRLGFFSVKSSTCSRACHQLFLLNKYTLRLF